MPAVRVWAVLAQEVNPPIGIDGLEWMLLTTVAVKQEKMLTNVWNGMLADGVLSVIIVLSRAVVVSRPGSWRVLVVCRNALAIDMIIAWRIHYLTTLDKKHLMSLVLSTSAILNGKH
ncbi:MAG: hypothetical protein HS127_11390 [Planctomycetia bacterium]|nr:hypothetical protein [Planctomycetia bacterium]